MSALDLRPIPGSNVFNVDNIRKYIVGVKNFASGARSVACGDVSAVARLDAAVGARFRVLVHTQLTNNKFYAVTVTVTNGGVCGIEAECPCLARGAKHHRCKHCAAALLVLFALVHHQRDAKPPVWGRRINIARPLTDPRDIEARRLVRFGLTWQDVLSRALSPPDRHNGTCWRRAVRDMRRFQRCL